jgi:hypothetical protein
MEPTRDPWFREMISVFSDQRAGARLSSTLHDRESMEMRAMAGGGPDWPRRQDLNGSAPQSDQVRAPNWPASIFRIWPVPRHFVESSSRFKYLLHGHVSVRSK